MNVRRRTWFLVYGGLIAGIYLKAHFLVAHFLDGVRYPVSHPLFPPFFCDSRVSLGAYLLPLVTPLILFFSPGVGGRQAAAALLLLSTGILLVHLDSYNDATFTTGVWVSLWLLWSATPRDRKVAAQFGKALIGLFFLGGAFGKLTAEYWDGSVLYDLYFIQKQNFPFPQLRAGLAAETLRSVATGFSRATVITELALGTLVFWPLRPAVLALATVTSVMIILSGIQLFSVVGPLFILAVALSRSETPPA